MQVLEAGAPAPALQVPSAEIVGLQFGLATSKEFIGFSVLKRQETLKSLVDPRLGLPAENEICATCGGTNYDECTGHFGHLKLTQPIFHPNHMRLVQQIFQKICLACGSPKEKKKRGILIDERAKAWKRNALYSEPEEENGNTAAPVVVAAEPGGDVIELSSDDEIPPDILQVIPHGPMDFTLGSTSQSSAMGLLPNLGSKKSKGKAVANGSAKSAAKKPAKSAATKPQSTQSITKNSKKIYKGRPAGLDVLNADNVRSSKKSSCSHCSPGNPDYRPILVRILPVKGRKIGESSEILQLEVVDNEDDVWLPADFWAFLGGPVRPQDEECKVPTKHVLSPSEAYLILKKIPERAIGKLGMNSLVARPEGLIMKYVPVPPNCTRTTDTKYVNNTTAVQFGSDNVTKTLQNLCTEMGRIQRTRTGKAMSRAQKEESTALQILTAHYLREKGAPKAVAGREPQKRDRNGRITKQDDHRWTKTWLSNNVLGKNGNFTAKAVIAGDPSLRIEEIGVPWAVAQKLTIPERATQWNCSKLQEFVDSKLQELLILKESSSQKGKPGATRIERGGQAFQVMLGSGHTHKVQIGDVVHRNIQDGDYVYVNRPPSVHKHSLMALKVHVHYGLVITVNPLVCPPFNADFDGDIFHLFVPQSMQATAELEQLMGVPRQIISDHGRQPLLGLTQDTLLAAHLLTNSKLFVDKASMHQLCLWSSKQPPEAAIVKSPKGGPLWTGEQIFELTLPEKLNMGSWNETILIQGGQILKWVDGTNLLRKENKSIAAALCDQLGADGLVDYLNNAAGLLHAWLQVQGFSTGLTDFQVTNNSAARQKMLQSIFEEYYMKSIQESCDSVRILDAKVQAMGPDIVFNPDNLTKNVRFLEQAAQQIFRARETDAESILAKYADKNNSLLLMVKSGSKGSRGKLLQQLAGMGLQLYKGKHLLPFSSSRRPSLSISPVLDWWEDKGLVRNSLVDGLTASGLFNHVTADRTGILRKHVEVAQPGTLFKSLMLFLRDLHVVYDGSVRSQCGNNLVQFCYGGAVGVPRRIDPKRGSIQNRLRRDDPITPMEEAEGDLTWEEDDSRRWPLSVLAGEPVGVLAATAISQPAYEVMLDAPSLNGPFMPRPLELVQETLNPRAKSDLKPSDRCVIIRLVNCLCTKAFCLERRVLDVQAFLTRVNLKTISLSCAIEFWDMENFGIAGLNGEELRSGSPWLGHIKLSLERMKHHQVGVEGILQRLREKFGDSVRNAKKQPMGQIYFCYSRSCKISNGYCLHFSPRAPRKMQNQNNSELYNAALLNLLMKIRRTIIPGLLDCTVKGDERLESVRIVSEGPTWTTSHNKLANNRDHDEELVLEIFVAPTKAKMKRNMPWAFVKEACLPLMDMVDWNRSMPYSIQEIRHALGVETAYQMVMRRLGLVIEKTAPQTHPNHVKLIADMMTFSGDANGFTISGYQDMNKVTAVSAPFTEASFKKPIRTLLDAAGRGATDSLEGVMTSCVWGKEAPLGTGNGFHIFWQPSKDMRRIASSGSAEKDVHAIWKDLDAKCIPDKVIPSSPAHSLPGLEVLPEGAMDEDEGAFSPPRAPTFNDADGIWGSNKQDDGAGWGNPPAASGDDAGWGTGADDGNEGGGWDLDESADGVKERVPQEADGWGGSEEKDGWGSEGNKIVSSGNAWDDKSAGDTQGGWGDDAINTGTEGGWDGDSGGRDASIFGSNQAGGRNNAKAMPDQGNFEKKNGWDSSPADQEGGDGGWGSVSTGVAGGDGWDSFARPQADSAEHRKSSERSDFGQGSRADDNPSRERIFPAREENGDDERTWNSGGGRRGRGRGGRGNDSRGAHVSGANVVPLGVRRQTGSSQERNVGEKRPWGDSLPLPEKTVESSGWDDVPSNSTRTPTQRDGNWKEPNADDPNDQTQSPDADQGTDSGVDWSQLVSGTTRVDAWESFTVSQGNEAAADGWDAISPESHTPESWVGARNSGPDHRRTYSAEEDRSYERPFRAREENRDSERPWTSGRGGRGRGRGGRGNDWGPSRATFRKPEFEPECKEIDDLVKSMKNILYNKKNECGNRLSDKDDEAVQTVLRYHPNLKEKTGCGVAYIKVDKSQDFPDVHCFWLVRTDGSEDEFSYHKCLKVKVQREFPSFIDRYDVLYTGRGRHPPAPPANSAEGHAGQSDITQAELPEQESARAADSMEEGNTSQQTDQESAPITVADTQASQSNW